QGDVHSGSCGNRAAHCGGDRNVLWAISSRVCAPRRGEVGGGCQCRQTASAAGAGNCRRICTAIGGESLLQSSRPGVSGSDGQSTCPGTQTSGGMSRTPSGLGMELHSESLPSAGTARRQPFGTG